MERIGRRAALALAGLWLGLAALPAARAEEAYPTKPVRFIVTFPPGGSSDLVARAVAAKLADRLGQSFIVDNRPGAGGNIGLDLVAKAPPDGYTIGLGAAGALAVNISLYKDMPFDPVKDFAPVTMLAEIPFVLVANPDLPAAGISELVALAKAKPGELSIAHGGNGTAMHLSAQLLDMMAGIDVPLIPYKGSGPAATDAAAGHVPLAMVDIPSSIAFIQGGRVRPLGLTSTKRVAALADVPTIAEQGVPGYQSVGWFGVVAPAGTPPAIVRTLNAAIGEVLHEKEIGDRFVAVGALPAPDTPEEFAATIKSEIAKWAKVIAASGAKIE